MLIKYRRVNKKLGFISTLCLILFGTSLYFKSLNPTSKKTKRVSNKNSKQSEHEGAFDSLNHLYNNCSDEQLLVNKTILMQTILFMEQETNELDPKLIEYVRSIMQQAEWPE